MLSFFINSWLIDILRNACSSFQSGWVFAGFTGTLTIANVWFGSQVNHTTSLHVVSILTKTPLDLLYTADTSEVGGAWGTVCVCVRPGEREKGQRYFNVISVNYNCIAECRIQRDMSNLASCKLPFSTFAYIVEKWKGLPRCSHTQRMLG